MKVRRFAAALLLLPWLLVSCSDDEPTSDPKEPTGSATMSPSPTGPVEPELPGVAKTADKRGAIAFLKYYWAMVDYAQASGDTSGLRQLSMPSCQSCTRANAYLEKVYRTGGVIRSESRTVRIRTARRGSSPGRVLFFINAHFVIPASQDFYGVGDKRNKRWRGGQIEYAFVVQRSVVGGSWQLTIWDTAA